MDMRVRVPPPPHNIYPNFNLVNKYYALSLSKGIQFKFIGEVRKRLNRAVLKTAVAEMSPWVRITPSPPSPR